MEISELDLLLHNLNKNYFAKCGVELSRDGKRYRVMTIVSDSIYPKFDLVNASIVEAFNYAMNIYIEDVTLGSDVADYVRSSE